jgi:hypothetical protein
MRAPEVAALPRLQPQGTARMSPPFAADVYANKKSSSLRLASCTFFSVSVLLALMAMRTSELEVGVQHGTT